MSHTPRVDALVEKYSGRHFLDDTECVRAYQLARELERELGDAKAHFAQAAKNHMDADAYATELDRILGEIWILNESGPVNGYIREQLQRAARLKNHSAGEAIFKSGDREVADQPETIAPGAAGTCTNPNPTDQVSQPSCAGEGREAAPPQTVGPVGVGTSSRAPICTCGMGPISGCRVCDAPTEGK